MFNIQSIPMQVTPGEGVTKVVVNPADVYPAVIARIQDVLQGANPTELLASSERGGSARADVLIQNARSLPEEAWNDALLPRSEFIDLPYFSFVEKNGAARQNLLALLGKEKRIQVERMIQRGHALDIALGWFCQALRLEFGAYDLTITRDQAFRL